VRVDAFPERLYPGTVKSVAVLPEQGGYFGSDTKVYQTIITIDVPVERLKPGMTAVAEIHVDRLENVLAVPVQAVVQAGKESACYVAEDGRTPQRRLVKLGRTNDKVVQILEGVGPGQSVVLNPMAIAEETRKPADAPAGAESPAEKPGIVADRISEASGRQPASGAVPAATESPPAAAASATAKAS
jgi:HlyD family secretion protein